MRRPVPDLKLQQTAQLQKRSYSICGKICRNLTLPPPRLPQTIGLLRQAGVPFTATRLFLRQITTSNVTLLPSYQSKRNSEKSELILFFAFWIWQNVVEVTLVFPFENRYEKEKAKRGKGLFRLIR